METVETKPDSQIFWLVAELAVRRVAETGPCKDLGYILKDTYPELFEALKDVVFVDSKVQSSFRKKLFREAIKGTLGVELLPCQIDDLFVPITYSVYVAS